MYRMQFIVGVMLWAATGTGILFWFFAPYLTTGIESHLPVKNWKTCSLAAAAFLAAACWYIRLVPPLPQRSRGLSLRTGAAISGLLRLVVLVSLARFTLPLFTSRFGRFSVTPDAATSVTWLGIMCASVAAHRFLPVCLKNVHPSADELLRRDRRRPILYLRSFAKEQAKAGWRRWTATVRRCLEAPEGYYLFSTVPGDMSYGGRARVMGVLHTMRSRFDEQMIFADAISEVGPYIALGRPGEHLNNMDLGAAKKYVSDDEWQPTVLQWLSQCAAVVLDAADSEGLAWEIREVVRIVPPTCVLIVCPHTNEEYGRFTRECATLFPKGIPNARPRSRLLTFDGSWEPCELKNVDLCAALSLEPFLQHVRSRGPVGG